jgi:hypothetical protein
MVVNTHTYSQAFVKKKERKMRKGERLTLHYSTCTAMNKLSSLTMS